MSAPPAMNELEALRADVEALRLRREELEREVTDLRARAEALRTGAGDRIRARASKHRLRATLVRVGAALAFIGVAAAAVAYVSYVAPDRLSGRVHATRGPVAIERGTRCLVTIDGMFGWHNTALVVDCGGVRLYGSESSGSARCTIGDAHRVKSCRDEAGIDEDGDPRLELDRAAGLVVVDDARWGIEIALDDAPRAR